MDVASSFAVSIAPPPFQKEVEEARRDTQNRVSIPKTQESAASNPQGRLADEKGSTDGENSLLNAQQKGISDAKDSIDPDGRRKQKRQSKQNKDDKEDNSDQQEGKDEHSLSQPKTVKFNRQSDNDDNDEFELEYKGEHYQEDQHPPFRAEGHLDFDDSPEARKYPRPGVFNPVTGCFEIPAYRNIKRRNILLSFKEKNVHFLDDFSDKKTAVGLINFALNRRYGSIIPNPRMGQVVEKLA